MKITRSRSTGTVAAGRRIWERSPLRLAATVHSDAGSNAAIVTDLNTEGCRLETACASAIGDPVTVAVSRSISIGGRIAWRDGERIGVAFCARLLPRAVGEALQKGVPEADG